MKNINIFDKLNKFLNKRSITDIVEPNVFNDYINGLDLDEEIRDELNEIGNKIDKVLKIIKNKKRIRGYNEQIEEQILELVYIESLSDEDIKELNNLISRYRNLNNESKFLQRQVGGFSKTLERMKEISKDPEQKLATLENAEKKHRILQRDINLLKGEKQVVIEESRGYVNALEVMNKITLAIVIMYGSLIIVLAFSKIFYEIEIFYPVTLIVISLLIYIPLAYVFKLKGKKEVLKNNRKQKRITDIMNKKMSVYAYYESFLEVTKKKYDSNNSMEVRRKIEKFNEYEKIESRKKNTYGELHIAIDKLEEFIESRRIPNNTSIDAFVKNVSIDDKKERLADLTKMKEKNIQTYKEIDMEHKKQWDEITRGKEFEGVDTTEIYSRLLKIYYDELEKIEDEKAIEKLLSESEYL